MVDIINTKITGESDAKVFIRGSNPRNATGRVVVTNKSAVETTFNDAGRFYESGAEFTIPKAYLTSANLPATVIYQVSGEGTAGYVTAGTGALSITSSSTEIEVSNDFGQSLPVAGKDKANVSRPLLTDTSGRLRQSHGQPDVVTGTISAIGNTVAIAMDGYSSATFYFFGTFTTANLTFEQSPDSTNGTDGNWFPTMAASVAANTASTTTGSISTSNTASDVSAPGASYVRVRATAIASGAINVRATASTSSSEPAPVIPTHAVTQSGVFTTTPIGGTAVTLLTAATTNGALDITGLKSVYEITLANPTATPAFFKFYNKATAPTVGTDTPILTIPIPANSFQSFNFGVTGKRFALGVGRAVTLNAVATDTTAAPAGIQVHYTYI